MALRLKMKLGCVTEYAPGNGRNTHYKLHAVMGEENKPWSLFTPCGTLEFTVTNDAAKPLENGREYFVTLEPVE